MTAERTYRRVVFEELTHNVRERSFTRTGYTLQNQKFRRRKARYRKANRADVVIKPVIVARVIAYVFAKGFQRHGVVVRRRLEERVFFVDGGKTLKSLCQEAGLTPQQRAALPVVCDRQGIVLVPGFGCDERVRLTESSEQILLFFPEIDGGQPLK